MSWEPCLHNNISWPRPCRWLHVLTICHHSLTNLIILWQNTHRSQMLNAHHWDWKTSQHIGLYMVPFPLQTPTTTHYCNGRISWMYQRTGSLMSEFTIFPEKRAFEIVTQKSAKSALTKLCGFFFFRQAEVQIEEFQASLKSTFKKSKPHSFVT